MSINTAPIAARVVTLGVTLENATTIVSEVIALITTAEEIYAGLKGTEKFQAVQAGVQTLVADLGLSDKFAALWRVLGPAVSLIVTIMNLRNLWPAAVAKAA